MKKTNAKRASAKKTKAAAAPVATSAKGGIPLKAICSALGIETKPARVKLRRFWRETTEKGKPVRPDFHSKNDRWVFSAAEAKEVRALLAPAK